MTRGFQAVGGGVAIDLDPDDAEILRAMAGLVLELVDPPPEKDEFERIVGIGTSTEKPDDPVLARLFPDAYSGDEADSSADFRRYTEDGLRLHKRENARSLMEALPASGGGRVELDLGTAHAWMKSLNDVRLALGTRLGIDEETQEAYQRGEAAVPEADATAMHLYDWLGVLQESLVQALFDAQRHSG
ncbi:DUF2017 domain-containing protein [Streptomonospora sp. PA3]|uniref:DUF2017 domain-containing protein n=1 Tax=Streptomonospora sp. PA3 TaxID=2607326 RepID=UPI0012DBF5A8|nr:DUF2017 domain-containing protein [Streptomonospora sp. PA3]MUL40111.1 DUF2017 domain-containing protein [Streptomonospora sp. PA3]